MHSAQQKGSPQCPGLTNGRTISVAHGSNPASGLPSHPTFIDPKESAQSLSENDSANRILFPSGGDDPALPWKMQNERCGGPRAALFQTGSKVEILKRRGRGAASGIVADEGE